MSKQLITKVLISTGALLLGAVHLIWPDLRIDAITTSLFVVAIAPWLSILFKSVEVTGLGKVEYQDLEKIGDRAESVGLMGVSTTATYSFENVDDPNLALAGMRIELERILKGLMKPLGIKTSPMLSQYFGALVFEKKITGAEAEVLGNLIPLLNQAAHGAAVDPKSARWAFTTGKQILIALDAKLSAIEGNSE